MPPLITRPPIRAPPARARGRVVVPSIASRGVRIILQLLLPLLLLQLLSQQLRRLLLRRGGVFVVVPFRQTRLTPTPQDSNRLILDPSPAHSKQTCVVARPVPRGQAAVTNSATDAASTDSNTASDVAVPVQSRASLVVLLLLSLG